MAYTAIFGGTFNPFHIGHFEMLKSLNKSDLVDKILLMPDKIPPHKVCDYLAEESVRIESCRIIADIFSKTELCLIEFERNEKSYTYDTVLLLKKLYPNEKFAFVFGGDMLVYFDKWYKYEQLMKAVDFIVFKRTDTDNDTFNTCVKRFSEMGMKITVFEDEIPAVSSTEIRKDIINNKNLIPSEIYDYLISRGAYLG